MRSSDLLSPLHLVELGRRLKRDTAEAAGVAELIDDARLVVQRGLDSLAGAAIPLGLTTENLKKAAFRKPVFNPYRWATKDPRISRHSWAAHELPAVRTVLYGKKQRPGSIDQYAFVYKHGAVVLLFEESDWGHASFSSLTQAADYHGQRKFWEVIGCYPAGARLLE